MRTHAIYLGLVLLTCPLRGHAYDLTDSLRVNGFGTIGVATNNSDDIQFRLHADQNGSAGRGEYNFGLHSIAGLQVSYQLTDRLSLTGQGVVRYLDESDWAGDLDWAYLTYEAPLELSIRAGKMRFPIFRSSELAYVGYSRTYARPALVFYGVGGYDDLTGAQLSRPFDLGPLELELQATFGRSQTATAERLTGSYDEVETDDIAILAARFETSHLWLNLAYSHLTTEVTRYAPGRAPSEGRRGKLRMLSAEWQLEWSSLVLEGGYGRALIDEVQPDETLFYSALSRPMGKVTPYILYSYKKFTDAPGPPAGSPARHREPPPDASEEIFSLGVRYDWRPGLAVKLEYDHVLTVGGAVTLSNNRVGGRGSHSALSLVLDWMF